MTVEELVSLAPVVPVVVIEDVEDAVPLAEALVRGGLPAIEVTLRTDAALAAIGRIAAEVEGAVVGAGTEIGQIVRWLAATSSVQMRWHQGSSTPTIAVSPLDWFWNTRRLAST